MAKITVSLCIELNQNAEPLAVFKRAETKNNLSVGAGQSSSVPPKVLPTFVKSLIRRDKRKAIKVNDAKKGQILILSWAPEHHNESPDTANGGMIFIPCQTWCPHRKNKNSPPPHITFLLTTPFDLHLTSLILPGGKTSSNTRLSFSTVSPAM